MATTIPDRKASNAESPLQLAYTITITALGFLLALLITPILLPLSLIFRIYRHRLHRRITAESKGDMIVASGDDAVWFQDTPKNPSIINSIYFVKGRIHIDKFQNLSMERIVNARNAKGALIAAKFSHYATKMYHRDVWMKDTNFDINNHVFMWEKTIPKNQRELEDLIGELCSSPLPPGLSPWQMILIPCYKGDSAEFSQDGDGDNDEFPILFRIHHAIGDGVALMRLMMQQVFTGHIGTKQLPKKFSSKGLVMRIVKAVFTGPSMILGRVFWPADNHALHGPALSGRKVFTWSDNMDLELIKRMKNAAGATVNDILMTCLAGSFHEYFKKYASETPADILTSVPVDIRSPKAELVVDNQFALVFLKLPVNVADRMQRLAETKARMESIKTSAEPLVNALTIRYLMARFPNWLTHILFDSIASKCSIVLSNVPGPQQPCYIDGLKLESMVFFPPQRSNVGIGISILSYNGSVKTGLMMDRRLCSNPKRLLTEFEKEVKAMAEQLNVLEDQGQGS